MPEFFPHHLTGRMERDSFARGYFTAAEWLLQDGPLEEGGIDRDKIRGWSKSAQREGFADCKAFEKANRADIAEYCRLRASACEARGYDAMECAGQDFWLSRNGHGTGFFDRGNEEVFARLQTAARVWSSVDPYLHRGWLYF